MWLNVCPWRNMKRMQCIQQASWLAFHSHPLIFFRTLILNRCQRQFYSTADQSEDHVESEVMHDRHRKRCQGVWIVCVLLLSWFLSLCQGGNFEIALSYIFCVLCLWIRFLFVSWKLRTKIIGDKNDRKSITGKSSWEDFGFEKKKKYGKFQNLKENVRYNEDFWQKGQLIIPKKWSIWMRWRFLRFLISKYPQNW